MIYHYFVPYAHPTGVDRMEYCTDKPVRTIAQIEKIEMMIEITYAHPYKTVRLTSIPQLLRCVHEENEEDGAPFDEEN